MDGLDILREMHGEAKEAFSKLEMCRPEERGGLWAKLRPELAAHEQIEERFIYDPVMNEARGRAEDLVTYHEKHELEIKRLNALCDHIGGMDVRQDAFLAPLRELRHTLEEHIMEEEGTIWPRIREVWGQENLDRCAGPMQAARTAAAAGASISGALGSLGETFRR